MKLFKDASYIIKNSLESIKPKKAMEKVIDKIDLNKDIYVLAFGKAAWEMSKILSDQIGSHIKDGLIITKYDHSFGHIAKFKIIEAGHPVLDKNSILAGEEALKFTSRLDIGDLLITLISGGGSSLMEKPLGDITLDEFISTNKKLLQSGADIVEFNTIRKHLSAVKGGRLALNSNGAEILNIIISDVLGDKLDFIASGPTVLDSSTSREALKIVDKYDLDLPDSILKSLSIETPKDISNSDSIIISNVEDLSRAAKTNAEKLGYKAYILANDLNCQAKEAGKFISSIAREIKNQSSTSTALIFGGETIVKVRGDGLGGRNQEIALSAAIELQGEDNILVFSLGSDGTDGPTDAAGGIVTGSSFKELIDKGIDPHLYLENNNSYAALNTIDALIKTGATGSNVNDISVVLIKKE